MQHDAIMFVGSPLDRKHLPNLLQDDEFRYAFEQNNRVHEVIYRKQEFQLNNKLVTVMMYDSLPTHYQKIVEQTIVQGLKDNLTVGNIVLCLPQLNDVDSI